MGFSVFGPDRRAEPNNASINPVCLNLLSLGAQITMRILLLNPNTSASVTGLMSAAAEEAKSQGTTIVPLTAERGVPYIASRAEAQIGGAIALEMLAEHHSTVDAAIIAAFGDPGLFGARELFDIPIVGLAEAADRKAS